MQNNISSHVSSLIPEFIRGDNPLFTDFITTYYKYVEGRTKAICSIHNRSKDTDIDETLESYISEFYATYGEYLPTELALDKRNFIKLLSSVYDAKGTRKSLELIFKAIFNENVNITYPSEQILRASDGVWVVDKFITVTTKFGEIPRSNVIIHFTNFRGDFVIDVTKIVQIEYNTFRLYFNTYSEIFIVDDQQINIYDETNALVYIGQLIKSPSYLSVTVPGNSWQVGQVITIPGKNNINSIAKVISIDSGTGIAKLEIREHGVHDQNEIVIVSPYKNRPASSGVIVESTLVSVSPDIYHHALTVDDATDGIYESVIGTTDSLDNSYYLTEYVERGYYGEEVVNKIFSQSFPPQNAHNTGITLQEWLDSRATLIYNFENLVSNKGRFLNENGQISNHFIRLQDNYFYQPFSYVIETARDIGEYRNLLKIMHPAGTKRFSSLLKEVEYDVSVNLSRTLSFEKLLEFDFVPIGDSVILNNNKQFNETLTNTDDAFNTLNKYMVDTVGVSSPDNAVTTSLGYFTPGILDEDYISDEHTITIG
jgi:hypothetical protein